MIGKRAKLALFQLLEPYPHSKLQWLFDKAAIPVTFSRLDSTFTTLRYLADTLTPEQTWALLLEVVASLARLRFERSPKYLFDEAERDLVRCLLLDGYALTEIRQGQYSIHALDPTITSIPSVEDELTAGLQRCGLPQAADIVAKFDQSAQHFRSNPPDLNASLTSARIALETTGKALAQKHGALPSITWGAAISHLKSGGRLVESEEKAITSVYTFISPGAHVPVGLTQEEMVRLGRSMAASMTYFLLKHCW